jgi:hypothetical protein
VCKLANFPYIRSHIYGSVFFAFHGILFQHFKSLDMQRMNVSVDPAVYDPRLEAGGSLYQPVGSAEAPSAAEEHQRLAVPYFAEIVG